MFYTHCFVYGQKDPVWIDLSLSDNAYVTFYLNSLLGKKLLKATFTVEMRESAQLYEYILPLFEFA